MKKIQLSKGKFAIVDDEDFEWLNQWKWHTSGSEVSKFYAARDVYPGRTSDGKRIHKRIYMHKQIMEFPRDEVDHINGDSLDNRKENLRITDHKHNGYNLKLYKNNKSGYKGVQFHKHIKKWMACIRVDRKLKHLGYFTTPEEAAKAYNIASRQYHKDFGRVN